MAKRPQPAPGAIYECDRLAHPLFLAIRLYANRLEVDMGTTYLHRYKGSARKVAHFGSWPSMER